MAEGLKNLLVRIGVDGSVLKSGLDQASKNMQKFSQDVSKSMKSINNKKTGLGALSEAGTKMKKDVEKGFNGFTRSLESMAKRSTGSLGEMAVGFEALTAVSAGLTEALGPVGLAVGAIGLAAAAAVAGIGAAAQDAVKFEADLGRLNRKLGESTQGYMQWARSMGLAKNTAADLGASYGLLLSSFIHDNKDLTQNTEQLVQATRVIADGTGRSIEDVQTRLKSGLMGNVEAINDLDIFANRKLIESTKAFQKFANGKQWDNLSFQVQQQILLAAILEQAYDRYGNTLQNNVMTKQNQLIETLKDVKLNLSLAFLPIWDKVLPVLGRLADWLDFVTDKIARFSFGLFHMNYDKATLGTENQTKAMETLGDVTQNTAKAAEHMLAAFDEINQLGNFDDGTGGPGGGSGGSGGSGSGKGNKGSSKGNPLNLPNTPIVLPGITFQPPTPPDAGFKAVAQTVMAAMADLQSNVNSIMASIKSAWTEAVSYMQAQISSYQPVISNSWGLIGQSVQSLSTPLTTTKSAWNEALAYMQSQINAFQPYISYGWDLIGQSVSSLKSTLTDIKATWHDTLDNLQSQMNSYQPYISYGWTLIKQSIDDLKTSLSDVQTNWHNTLDKLQSDLNSYQPYIIFGIGLIKSAIDDLLTAVVDTALKFPTAMQTIYDAVNTATQPIVSLIASIQGAYNSLMATLGQSISGPTINMDSFKSGVSDLFSGDKWKQYGQALMNSPAQVGGLLSNEASKPENQTAFTIWSSLLGGGGLLKGAGSVLQSGLKSILGDIFKSSAGSNVTDITGIIKAAQESMNAALKNVSGFASGGIVSSPTLAWVGEGREAEAIAPLSDLQDMIASAVGNAMMVANRTNTSNQKSGDIVLQLDGTTLARIMTPYNIKESTRIGTMQVVPG